MRRLVRASARGFSGWILLGILCANCGPAQPPVTPSGPVMVVGTLSLMVAGNTATTTVPTGADVELPDVDVSLEQDPGGTVATAKTQLDGKFRVQAPGPGSYRICWKSPAIGAGCGEKFAVAARSVWLRVVPVTPPRGVIYGRVLTGDARPCWLNDPFFALTVSTRVSLIEAPAVLQSVRANISGEYAFAGVKLDRNYQIRAECEKAAAEKNVTLSGGAAQANLTLPNHAPRFAGMSAFAGGKGITRAASGATVMVDAHLRDPDNDPIEYLWRTLDGSGSMPGTSTREQEWKLAPMRGLQTTYVMARDGRGGYAFRRLDLPVGAGDAGFAGRVIDETTLNAISSARVEVSGIDTTTNAQGWFSLRVPIKPWPERYVLNITHPQYARLSRIHDRDALGNTYELTRAQVSTHNPATVIDVVDTGSAGPCGAPGGQRVPQVRPLRASVKGRNDRYPDQQQDKPCRHRGAHITVKAGALMDLDKNPPAPGPVKLSFATLNPSRRAIPGDYRAVDRNGQPAEMLSFGALYAEFRGADNKLLRLRDGASADVSIPVSDKQRPSAPPAIAMWHYDDQSGMWSEDGTATLQNTPEGWMYVGKTTHFSEINMDVAGNDPAQATCVRFELGSSLAGWTNLVVRAYVSYAGTSVQVKETALDSQQYHSVFRIPYAPPAPPPNTLRLELRGTYNGQQVLLLNNVIATDAPRPKMTGNNLWPPFDGFPDECGDVVVLEADPVNLPPYGDNDATGRPYFLTGPYGQFLPENGEQIATEYYNVIDPADANYPTLSKWWKGHGFNEIDGSGGKSAPYLNYNDLGFGRDMNCLEDQPNPGDLSCYVTNYGLPDQNLANADFAFLKQGDKRGATVAMEYLVSEPADRRVRFYVYAGGDPAAAGKLKFADLDGLGPKPVPHLCMVCHGGSYLDAPDSNVQHARFREFDLPSFKYPGGKSWDFGSPNLTPNELDAFANLNRMVGEISPGTSAIGPLITAWYGPTFSFGEAPVQPALPAGWNPGDANVYHNVYGKSCRTCHIARDNAGVGDITLNSSADFQSTYFVCGQPKRMPNAYVTWKNFWSDPQRVIDYAVFTNQNPCQ